MSTETATKATARELIDRNLAGFKIVEIVEVFRVNEDGHRIMSVGVFQDQNIATVFAGMQPDPGYSKTGTILVLTDGNVAYPMSGEAPVKVYGDEVLPDLKEKTLAKLTLEERILLKLQ